MALAPARPSIPGILMSRMARSGRISVTSFTASSPRAVSPTTSYPCSCRVSFRSRRMMASSSAITTRTAKGVAPCGGLAGLDHEAVEELVLRPLEVGDRCHQGASAPGHGVGMALGVAVLLLRLGRLVDQGPDPGVVGVVGQGPELLVKHDELFAGAREPVVDLSEAALDG